MFSQLADPSAAGTSRFDVGYRSIMYLFKNQDWSEEELTSELVKLANHRKAVVEKIKNQGEIGNNNMIDAINHMADKERWSNEKRIEALQHLTAPKQQAPTTTKVQQPVQCPTNKGFCSHKVLVFDHAQIRANTELEEYSKEDFASELICSCITKKVPDPDFDLLRYMVEHKGLSDKAFTGALMFLKDIKDSMPAEDMKEHIDIMGRVPDFFGL